MILTHHREKLINAVLVQWSEEDQAFIATVPALPGLSAFGETQEEALRELDIAKGAFLEVMREDGEFAPLIGPGRDQDPEYSFSG